MKQAPFRHEIAIEKHILRPIHNNILRVKIPPRIHIVERSSNMRIPRIRLRIYPIKIRNRRNCPGIIGAKHPGGSLSYILMKFFRLFPVNEIHADLCGYVLIDKIASLQIINRIGKIGTINNNVYEKACERNEQKEHDKCFHAPITPPNAPFATIILLAIRHFPPEISFFRRKSPFQCATSYCPSLWRSQDHLTSQRISIRMKDRNTRLPTLL